jgi:glycosidase
VILGEIWYDSQLFLNGDQFDSSMNYPFRNNIIKLLANNEITLKDFINRIITNKYKYSEDINAGLFNLIGSHDTERISVSMKGNHLNVRIAIVLLFLFPGSIS